MMFQLPNHFPNRRTALKTTALMVTGASPWMTQRSFAENGFYPPVKPRRLEFPKDHGSHPDYRTEWWYLTGWLGEGPSAMGFQLTFFRSRTQHAPENPSRLAPSQLLFAHAAMAVGQDNVFVHANRAGRLNGTSLRADPMDTHLQFEDWYLKRIQDNASEVYEGRFSDQDYGLSFTARTAQKVILRGREGVSPKGPRPEQASYYYSRAPLQVKASVQWGAQKKSLQGRAWLDHEWSSQLLMPGAVGWDWLGIHLRDGGTLMAFRIRNKRSEAIYAHVDARDSEGRPSKAWRMLRWQPSGSWRSKSLIDYPVPMDLLVGAERYRLVPLLLAQEVDARASTGGFYWEGAVSLMQGERLLGQGYLELTGYGAPLQL